MNTSSTITMKMGVVRGVVREVVREVATARVVTRTADTARRKINTEAMMITAVKVVTNTDNNDSFQRELP